jgi:hypothetical protein
LIRQEGRERNCVIKGCSKNLSLRCNHDAANPEHNANNSREENATKDKAASAKLPTA